MIYTDKPIQNKQQDLLGREEFVSALSNTIISYEDKDNLIIGLNGRWGSGKTSIMNLLEKDIKEKNKLLKNKYIFLKFNPWNFKEQDELIQSFFKDIYSQLHMIDWRKISRDINDSLDFAIDFLSINDVFNLVGLTREIKKYANLLHKLSFNDSLSKTKSRINKRLNKFKGKLIVYIDDIDRLNDKEINQIFQLVKLLADFDNLIYILSYDHNVVKSALESSQKNYAEEYLEKIVQMPITIPNPSHLRLECFIESELKTIIGDINMLNQPIDWYRLDNINFYKQFNSIREINRYINIFRLKYVPLRKEVDAFDFALVTLFEIKFMQIYKFLYYNRAELCGLCRKMNNGDERNLYSGLRERVNDVIETYYPENKEFIIAAMRYLFPKYNAAYYTNGWYDNPSRAYGVMTGKLYIEEKFNLYFSLSTNDLVFSNVFMNDIIHNQTKEEFFNNIEKINIDGKIGDFVLELCDRADTISSQRFDELIDWICYLLDNVLVDELYKWSNDIAKTFINFYKRRRSLSTKFKELIYKNDINYMVIRIMICLESERGRFYEQVISKYEPIDLEELLEMENSIIEKLENQFNLINIKYINWFREKFYFMCNVDNEFMKNWCKFISKDEEAMIELLVNVINKQFSKVRGEKDLVVNYFFDINFLKQFLEVEKYYEIVKKKVKSWSNGKNDNLYALLSFLRYNEKGLDYPIVYTKNELDDYYKTLIME